MQALGGEAAPDGLQISGGGRDEALLAFRHDLIGDGFQRLAIGQDDMTCAALIGMRCAFLLIQRLPAGFGDFQDNAFNIATKAWLEIQHTTAATLAEEIKGESCIGQDAGADGPDCRRIMAGARAPGAPIRSICVGAIGEAVARGHGADQRMASRISINVPSAMR